MALKVAINGMGRIGRCTLAAIIESGRKDIEVVAINAPMPLETLAHLIKYDSVHGKFPGDVRIMDDKLFVGQLRCFRVEMHHQELFDTDGFETPAEINAIRMLGADAVGMSTAPETIIARHIDLPVVAISCVTNYAAGMTGEALSHTETKTEAAKAEATFRRLIRAFVRSFSSGVSE